MKQLLIMGIIVLALLGLTACNSEIGTDQAQSEQTAVETAGDMSPEASAPQAQTEYISAVPEEYFAPSDHPGQVVEVTYDSRDYTDAAEPAIQKTAYVYLPYGYDEADPETRYDILYLMHGWTMTAGDFFDTAQSGIVPMLDHMIENGDIPPVIVVCATFDAQNQSQDFSRSVEELSIFHRDLRENLIPFVESRYRTYAEDVTEEGLQASREHRAFGGFSLGAVTTWYQFIYNLDYIKYFVPMSGDCWIMGTYGGLYQPVETVNYLEQVVSDGGWSGDDFYIYQGIGTSDPIWDQTDSQIQEMMRRDLFTADNLHYAVIEGGRHDIDACERYLYHALQNFFGNQGDTRLGFSPVTRDTLIQNVMNNPVFGDDGHLLFPVDRTIPDDMTLEDAGDILVWYNDINPDKTVEIVNALGERAAVGDAIFYDIYTEEEKAADPDKEDTGLFFFRGEPGGRVAICNAGGGFVYVGAMQDSFPHALELSKQGYNAFALIYRPGAQTACEDLARAIAFLHENAEELDIDMADYSLWGGSAGAQMAAWLGTYGTEAFGEQVYPRPAAVIMQYTGLSEVTGDEPPTYCCVGTSDGIASYRTMEERVRRIQENGTDAEIKVFDGLPHGFGLGEGTVAEGWIDHAVAFWERQMTR
ncbi:MAG TPA: esterase [Candidatus Onthomonas avicola]|nr:esterase [Candidatus Onthomonas avicola]